MTDREPLPHDRADLEALLNADDTRITELETDLDHSTDDRQMLVAQLARANERITQLEQHLQTMIAYLDTTPPAGMPAALHRWIDAVQRDLQPADAGRSTQDHAR